MGHIFNDLCLKPHVIEVAGILNYVDHFHDDPDFAATRWRNASYRFFVLWMWGKLGYGNRVVVPSCCVKKIRQQFPSPDGRYKGYMSNDEEWEGTGN